MGSPATTQTAIRSAEWTMENEYQLWLDTMRLTNGWDHRQDSIEYYPIPEEQTSEQTVAENSHQTLAAPSPLLDLPLDLVLNVTDHLNNGAQVMLSLTCKELFKFLAPRLDLSFRRGSYRERLRFLRLLEVDHPRYLTCRSCGRLFPWRRCQRWQHRCMCEHWYPPSVSGPYRCFAYIDYNVSISQETVDLVLRAQRRGMAHGLPLRILESKGVGNDGVKYETVARMVDDQLLYHSCKQVELESPIGHAEAYASLELSLCWHQPLRRSQHLWNLIWQMPDKNLSLRDGGLEVQIPRCVFCMTDAKMYVSQLPNQKRSVTMKVWRNFGRGSTDDETADQMFLFSAYAKFTDAEISRRNLKADFERGLASHVIA